jgi:transcriptional regulator with XRE-family HTH domain
MAKDPAANPEDIGRRLREARESLGLSQSAVARAVGIPRPSVSELEAGRRRVAVTELAQMAQLYRRPVSYFIDEAGESLEGDPVTEALFRTTNSLSDADRAQVLRFAEFLRAAGPADVPGADPDEDA